MTGVVQLLAAGGTTQYQLTVGSTTFTAKATSYYDGFAAATGNDVGALTGAFGALAPTNFKGATVTALYWVSNTGHVSSGTTYIEFSGTQGAGFVNSVSVNGTSLGTVGAPTTGSGYTKYQLGGASVSNPFGTSGTKKVVLS